MACQLEDGHLSWRVTREKSGHRTYRITHRVSSTTKRDGPANVLQTPGLPLPGSIWNFKDDIDVWAFCGWEAEVAGETDDHGPEEFFTVEQVFSTKPLTRCNETNIENPLLEPDKISGAFNNYQEEAVRDRFFEPITTSSHEQIRGPQVEFDSHRCSIKIVQKVAALQLDLLNQLANHVNEEALWGFGPRCIKFNPGPWEEHFYGTCFKYFQRELNFDVYVRRDPEDPDQFVSGFDRDLLDEGTKVLKGHWGRGTVVGDDPDTHTGTGTETFNEGFGWVLDPIEFDEFGAVEYPDENNPAHFIRFKDRNGENCRVILDGHGRPFDVDNQTTGTGDDQPGKIHVEYYPGADFTVLGIPIMVGV